MSGKKPMEFESGLKKYIKGEINTSEVGIITVKDKYRAKMFWILQLIQI